jgi:hypothetical protein
MKGQVGYPESVYVCGKLYNSEQITLFHLNTIFVSCLYLLSLASTALHNLHSTAHVHATSAATTLAGRRAGSVKTACSLCLLLLASGVDDGLVN